MPGVSLIQRNKNTDLVYLSYSSPKTPGKTYLYNLKTKEKKLVKEQEIPSGHNPDDYIVERLECPSHDGRLVPLTITRHKKTKINGSANLLLYGYGSYGSSMTPDFSSTRLSLIDRDIIWVTAHIRGGMEKGMKWWKEGKLLNKKNTFEDYIHVAKFLIEKGYSSKGKIIGMGGSAGGLLMGAVVNQSPELFLGIVMAVPFVDSLTTNLDHSLPLTVGEFDEFGNAKDKKDHFDYIYSYAPYNNIKKMDYPHMLITTSLSDNRVLFDEPAKFTAKLRDLKTDNNLLLLKTEMNAGHGGKSGRDGAIEEIAFDYAFILKPFSIGFDDMFDQFENMLGNGSLTMQSNYPPYNIRKTGKDNYAIEVALAGFNKNDVEVEFEDNLLTVRTKQVNKSENNNADGEIIHKGISQRQFARSFTIADDVKVNGAELKDGLLTISCERIVPEHKKRKLIEIK